MKKDLDCPYGVLDRDVICEHKFTRISLPSKITLHNHDGYEILLFLGGDASIVVESEEKKLERGDLVFISAYAFHGIGLIDSDRYERIVIDIRWNCLRELGEETADLTSCFSRTPAGKLNILRLEEEDILTFTDLADRLEDSLTSQAFGHGILAKAYLSELMVMACRLASTYTSPSYDNIMPSVVSKTFTYIDANLTAPLTVEQIAKEIHHNSDYLSRVFKDTTGGSLKQYINARKMFLARQYLQQGYPPYEVCFMIGYNNYSSFSRRFSAQIGCSPKQYQKTLGSAPETARLTI